MTKEETKMAAEIMLAFAEGKKIQVKNKDEKEWFDFTKSINPTWNFEDFDYRIAPDRKYRPFKNTDEAFREAKKHGFWVKYGANSYSMITNIDGESNDTNFVQIWVACDAEWSNAAEVLENNTWADTDEPCGILEE